MVMDVAFYTRIQGELSDLINKSYIYFAEQDGIVYLADLTEFVYWDFYHNEKDKLLDEAIARRDNEIYNLSVEDFIKYTNAGAIDVPQLEPLFSITDFLYAFHQYIESQILFVQDSEHKFYNLPLKGVW